ncbi:MAG: porin [Oceanospirillaceae bacterium]|nr:porin [Oceanospirillaceae bacterium]|tara:strand:- start:3308 stop:4495 length:1188 start_codon:yes stop_codon:yes gene_type:complete
MRKTSMILLAAALPMAVQAANTEFKFGGYVKYDAMMTKYSDAELGAGSATSVFYIPAAVPVKANDAEVESTSFDSGVKNSRFNFKTTTSLDNGEKVVSFIELDFFTGEGDERISNSSGSRLRHAFFKYGNYTFGHTWTTLMNPAHLPESVDFVGVSDGAVFARQAMVRYTNGPLQIALENPETTVANTAATGADSTSGANNVSDDSTLPDMIVRYNIKADNADFMVAGIARQFAYTNPTNTDGKEVDESVMRFGLTASGKVQLGKDDLKFSIAKGHLGRYTGIGQSNDATLTDKGDLVGNSVLAAYVGYRHFWTDSVRSTLAYSMFRADNHSDTHDTEAEADAVNESSKSIRANVMWSPAPKMTFGVEASKATLKKESGLEGDLKRLHFTAKYAF